MKKLNLSKFEEIKKRHLEYCSELNAVAGLDEAQLKLLFIKNPFMDSMEVNPIYFEEPFRNINLISAYNTFRKYKKTKWNGVTLIEKLGVRVCPYCGMNYFSTLRKENTNETVSVATFDHYIPKESPTSMLALNIYNLVPCCKNCNSTFKGTNPTPIINPYFEAVENNIKFNLAFEDNIRVNINNIADNEELNRITEHHINTLSLRQRYNYFRSVAVSIYDKKLSRNDTYLSQLSDFKELNLTKDKIKKMLIYQDLYHDNEPFIKLKNDIWEQFDDEYLLNKTIKSIYLNELNFYL